MSKSNEEWLQIAKMYGLDNLKLIPSGYNVKAISDLMELAAEKQLATLIPTKESKLKDVSDIEASAIDELSSVLEAGMFKFNKDAEFANSLVTQFKQKGGLSEKQWQWVTKMIQKALSGPPPAKGMVLPIQGLVAHFHKAHAFEQYPRIRVAINDKTRIAIVIAGLKSKSPGTLRIMNAGYYDIPALKRTEELYYKNFHASINTEGELKPYKDAELKGGGVPEHLGDYLKGICEEPLEWFESSHYLDKKCSLCGKATTELSFIHNNCMEKWGF